MIAAKKKRSPVSVRRLKSLPKSNGIHAVFVPLSKKKGAKLFCSKNKRDECAEFQARLAVFGLAPKVFQWFETRLAGHVWYGFVTERAEVRVNNENPNFVFQASGNYTNHGIRAEHKKAYPQEHVGQLLAAINALGAVWPDCHPGNIGYIGNRLVAIDCDPEYFAPNSNESPLWPGESVGL